MRMHTLGESGNWLSHFVCFQKVSHPTAKAGGFRAKPFLFFLLDGLLGTIPTVRPRMTGIHRRSYRHSWEYRQSIQDTFSADLMAGPSV